MDNLTIEFMLPPPKYKLPQSLCKHLEISENIRKFVDLFINPLRLKQND